MNYLYDQERLLHSSDSNFGIYCDQENEGGSISHRKVRPKTRMLRIVDLSQMHSIDPTSLIPSRAMQRIYWNLFINKSIRFNPDNSPGDY